MDYVCAVTLFLCIRNKPFSSKRFKLTCAPIEGSDQSVHPHSLISVFDRCSIDSYEPNFSSGIKLRL